MHEASSNVFLQVLREKYILMLARRTISKTELVEYKVAAI